MAGNSVKRSDIPPARILLACRAFHDGHGATPDIALADRYPCKVIMAKMDQMSDQGLIEYGVSLRTAWPTNKGMALLAELVIV